MSELRVDNIVDMGGSGAPQLRKGANVTGISTITQAVVGNATINAGGINATGIVTSSSNKFVGDFASGNITAGVMTATSSVVASNITINSGGINASGIVSATSYAGSGANLSGVGLSIAPLVYNPDVSDSQVTLDTGIGITFNQRVFAGTGNVTLSLTSVGSTLVENFGVGSSVTYNNDADPPNITITPTSNLSADTKYAISYPSGAFTQSGAGGSFVGTAYTFSTKPVAYQLWAWGNNSNGSLGVNNITERSSPVQIPGTTWDKDFDGAPLAVKTDGTLWAWGTNDNGFLGQNQAESVNVSSPVQIPGTTWRSCHSSGRSMYAATKTDGTLWVWGNNAYGQFGNNEGGNPGGKRSSPIQIPGTTWTTDLNADTGNVTAVKTDGTLWAWGFNNYGALGQNNRTDYSSPVQIGSGTDWSKTQPANGLSLGLKTDGTLWAWGYNDTGNLGQNNVVSYSSPVQIPGTTWSSISASYNSANDYIAAAIRTDGTLWTWGDQYKGSLGHNQESVRYSSPTQIPGTTWSKISSGNRRMMAVKTDNTLWSWGFNDDGSLGQNSEVDYSSPVQIPGTWYDVHAQNREKIISATRLV